MNLVSSIISGMCEGQILGKRQSPDEDIQKYRNGYKVVSECQLRVLR